MDCLQRQGLAINLWTNIPPQMLSLTTVEQLHLLEPEWNVLRAGAVIPSPLRSPLNNSKNGNGQKHYVSPRRLMYILI